MTIQIQISEEFIGKRIDVAVSELIPDMSRSKFQKLVKDGEVLVDSKILENSSRKITCPCEVIINDEALEVEEYEIIAEDIPLDILFEDEHIVVINKPAGMVCHPAPGHKSGTLVNALSYHFKNSLSDVSGQARPGIVHRLDKDTSGVMMVAKTNQAHNAFAELFAKEKGKSIKRKYICFVFGVPFDKIGRIETFITRHPKFRQLYTTSETSGKNSITLYETIRSVYFTSTKAISILNCELLTGRTHQIRVHMKHIGHHIIGDKVYGKAKIEHTYPDLVRNFPRQALHSSELSFTHPITREKLCFEAPLPEDLESLVELFEKSKI